MRELDDARDWMLTLGRKTAYEKVASFLRLIATAYDPERNDLDGVVRFELPLTRHEMADFLGLTTETVSRQMTALRKNGIIETIRSHIIIVHDWDALAQASGT
jgi:CRP/FNR family transcriptional regulator